MVIKNITKKFLKMIGLFNLMKGYYYNIIAAFTKSFYLQYLPIAQRKYFLITNDPVRYGSIGLALERLNKLTILGALAEVGVYRGVTSKIIHALAPDRKFYLFDTFEGFPVKDLEIEKDNRFKDTNKELVKKTIGNMDNVYLRPGYFPETTSGLENEVFAFVMLDVDLYAPTLAGLKFFYDRLSPGGYIFLHDYNSPESNWSVSRAADEFMADKPESIICIPDSCGSALICKNNVPCQKQALNHLKSCNEAS